MFQSEFSPFEQVEKHYGGKKLLLPTIQLELLEKGRKVETMEDKGAADGRIHLMARWDPHGVASYPSQFYVVKAKGVLLHIDGLVLGDQSNGGNQGFLIQSGRHEVQPPNHSPFI